MFRVRVGGIGRRPFNIQQDVLDETLTQRVLVSSASSAPSFDVSMYRCLDIDIYINLHSHVYIYIYYVVIYIYIYISNVVNLLVKRRRSHNMRTCMQLQHNFQYIQTYGPPSYTLVNGGDDGVKRSSMRRRRRSIDRSMSRKTQEWRALRGWCRRESWRRGESWLHLT